MEVDSGQGTGEAAYHIRSGAFVFQRKIRYGMLWLGISTRVSSDSTLPPLLHTPCRHHPLPIPGPSGQQQHPLEH